MSKIRIFITDDHALFRQGVKDALLAGSNIELTGEAESVEQLMKAEALTDTDILLLDITLGNESGLNALPLLFKKYSELKVLILSMHNKPVLLKRAVNSGIRGYILKQSPPERLHEAVKTVFNGGTYLDPELSDSIFYLLNDPTDNSDEASHYSSLSNREQEIFRLLAEEHSTSRISKELFISRKTVENHRSKILSKLKLDSPAEIVQLAEKLGII